MNVRLIKEQRSLRPAFYATLAGTVLTALIFNGNEAAGVVITAFTAGAALLAASSFGNEFNARTMLLLLAQPVPRHDLWLEKMRALGIKLALSYAALLLSLFLLVSGEGKLEHFPLMALALTFIPLCAFCSTPYFTLSSKSILLGMVSTAGVPWMLMMLVLGVDLLLTRLWGRPQLFFEVAADQHPVPLWSAVAVAALGYCAAIYRQGHRAFMNFQAMESQVQEVSLPAGVERALAPWVGKFLPGYTGPFASLVRKELHLQRAGYIIAALTAIVLPFLAMAWSLHPSEVLAGLMGTPLALCVLLIPFLTGIVTVADERNFGVTAWQLMLPASARKQWAAKMLVACFTTITLGVVFPIVLLAAGHWLFGMHTEHLVPDESDAFWVLPLGYVTLFSLIIYASTISPNLIRAMVAALGLLAGCGGVISFCLYMTSRVLSPRLFLDRENITAGMQQFSSQKFVVHTLVTTVVILFILLITLLNLLAFRNYRAGELTARRIATQITALLLCVGISVLVIGGMFMLANVLLPQN